LSIQERSSSQTTAGWQLQRIEATRSPDLTGKHYNVSEEQPVQSMPLNEPSFQIPTSGLPVIGLVLSIWAIRWRFDHPSQPLSCRFTVPEFDDLVSKTMEMPKTAPVATLAGHG
jgi:hypothetical protein